MEQRLWMILQLFGGAALFLYSMDTLTDALQQAAGDTVSYTHLTLPTN